MDVMKIARERRDDMVEQIEKLKGEIARIDEFMELAEEIASGKPAETAPVEKAEKVEKDAKVTEFNANIFAPADDAKAS